MINGHDITYDLRKAFLAGHMFDRYWKRMQWDLELIVLDLLQASDLHIGLRASCAYLQILEQTANPRDYRFWRDITDNLALASMDLHKQYSVR